MAFEVLAARLIEKRLGHLAARAVVDADKQDFLFHDWISGLGWAQHPGSRIQRQANIAVAVPSGEAAR